MVKNRPGVGVAVLVIKNNKILLGQRKGKHGGGTWGFPGGKLEYGEELIDCARREVKEETSLILENIRFVSLTNDIFKGEAKHNITVFMLGEYTHGNPVSLEPDKVESWKWFSWDDLPRPLFLPIENLLKQNFHPLQRNK